MHLLSSPGTYLLPKVNSKTFYSQKYMASGNPAHWVIRRVWAPAQENSVRWTVWFLNWPTPFEPTLDSPHINHHSRQRWMVMSLVRWYGSIHFYFRISSISTSILTYYDAWYWCDALHELCEPLRSLVLNAQFLLSLYCSWCILLSNV